MMRTLRLAAIRAFLRCAGADRVVRAAHIALGFGCFSFWNCHSTPRFRQTLTCVSASAEPVAPFLGENHGRWQGKYAVVISSL